MIMAIRINMIERISKFAFNAAQSFCTILLLIKINLNRTLIPAIR